MTNTVDPAQTSPLNDAYTVLSDMSLQILCVKMVYGKCPKISNIKVSEKMTYANSADPHQTAPEGGLIRVYIVCHSTKYFKKQLHKKQILGQNSME